MSEAYAVQEDTQEVVRSSFEALFRNKTTRQLFDTLIQGGSVCLFELGLDHQVQESLDAHIKIGSDLHTWALWSVITPLLDEHGGTARATCAQYQDGILRTVRVEPRTTRSGDLIGWVVMLVRE